MTKSTNRSSHHQKERSQLSLADRALNPETWNFSGMARQLMNVGNGCTINPWEIDRGRPAIFCNASPRFSAKFPTWNNDRWPLKEYTESASAMPFLDELYAHQEWADAEHWRAIEVYPPALADKTIRERLHHIHLVQHAFLWITGPRIEPFLNRKLEEFTTMCDLKQYAREGLSRLAEFVRSLEPAGSEAVIDVIWFHPPAKISICQALMQAAMHSHYHRGQNATRLRELGGVPPTTDFIVWLHQGQPPAKWS